MENNKETVLANDIIEEKAEVKEGLRSATIGKEITPNNIWKTMSIKQLGTTNVITEVCNACMHTIVRTIIEKAGIAVHASMTVVPNFTSKTTKNKDGYEVVVFTRGV